MNEKKSWIFILLFSLSLNLFHGFISHSHTDEHATLHQHETTISHAIEHHDTCDQCPCFHLNFTIELTQDKLPQLATLKPRFEQAETNPLAYNLTLDKPPTA